MFRTKNSSIFSQMLFIQPFRRILLFIIYIFCRYKYISTYMVVSILLTEKFLSEDSDCFFIGRISKKRFIFW